METTSACFEIKRDIDGDLIGYRNGILIWLTLPSSQIAYCYSQGMESTGILAKFNVKQLKGIQDAN